MGSIGSLICGSDKTEGIAKIALSQLGQSIDSFGRKAVAYMNEPISEDFLRFGPFCARVLLENACAALVGRLDSFRMLYLSEFQSRPEYDPGKRARSAFSWSGDVIPDEKLSANLWNIDHDLPKINRALFSQHLDHVYWKPAVTAMLDHISARAKDPMLSDILALDPENYITSTRGKSLQLYSTLSKGVHWEFFTSALLFDEVTVRTLIRDTCVLVSHLGLASHFIPTAYASLSPEEAINAYIAFRKDVP